MIRGQRIFITGGAGFIGSHLVERLARDNRVTIYDSLRRNALALLNPNALSGVTIIRGDILDAPAVRKAMRGADLVLHLAAIAGVSSYYAEPVRTMEVNLLGTYHVLKAALEHRVERVIDFSTSEIYGDHASNAREASATTMGPPGQLRWTYGISKLAAEHLGMAYHVQHKLPLICLRPFNVYGPRQVGEGAVSLFIRSALAGKSLVVKGKGSPIRAWCYITDMIEATLLAARAKRAVGRCFNIGNPRAIISTLELARKIIALSGSRSKIKFAPPPPEEIHLRVPCIDQAEELLGYAPRVELDEGLEKTIQWFRKSSH